MQLAHLVRILSWRVEFRFDHVSPAQSPHSRVNVCPRMAIDTRGSIVLPAKGSLLYEVRGKLETQVLCRADDNPRRPKNTVDPQERDFSLTVAKPGRWSYVSTTDRVVNSRDRVRVGKSVRCGPLLLAEWLCCRMLQPPSHRIVNWSQFASRN